MAKKLKFKSSKKDRLAVCTILSYGHEWTLDTEDPAYESGGQEALAHAAACWICQNEFDGQESIDTGETRDALELDIANHQTPEQLLERLEKHIMELKAMVN